MLPSDTVINCINTSESSKCLWYSPSSSDRSNPNNNKICPSNKDLCWRDTLSTKPREFKCGSCYLNSQTDDCHISLIANKDQDTTIWESTMTTNFNSKCINNWMKF